MLFANLIRLTTGDQGTFGIFSTIGLELVTVEPPWRNNQTGISCIPDDNYFCEVILSPKFGWTYGLRAVPDRTNILIHPGNWAGDRIKGFRSNSYGCILPGMKTGLINGQAVVLKSRIAFRELKMHFCDKPFKLNVRSLFDGPNTLYRGANR